MSSISVLKQWVWRCVLKHFIHDHKLYCWQKQWHHHHQVYFFQPTFCQGTWWFRLSLRSIHDQICRKIVLSTNQHVCTSYLFPLKLYNSISLRPLYNCMQRNHMMQTWQSQTVFLTVESQISKHQTLPSDMQRMLKYITVKVCCYS
jgi:hypothetical protein